MISSNLTPVISTGNTVSSYALAPSTEWVGTAEFNLLADVMITAQITGDADIFMQFSEDGITWTSSIKIIYDPTKINPPQPRVKGPRFYRSRVVNTSSTNPITITRLTTYYGDFKGLVSDLNSIVPQSFPGTVTRPIDFNLMVAKGLYQGHNNTIKDAFTPSMSSGTILVDADTRGGVYAGFPTGAIEPGEIIVSGADTGTVVYTYLASPDDEDYTFATLAVSGAGTYPLGHNVWRSNFMYFISNNPLTTNVGLITLRNTITTTNIFVEVPIGYGQSFCGAYTVPAKSSIYIDRITSSVRGSASGSLNGVFYYRDSISGGHRYRFPFEAQFGSLSFDEVDYLIKIPEKVDFIPRFITSSANNLIGKVSYRFIKVSE